MIRHILLIQFRSDATPVDIAAVQAIFEQAPQRIPGLEAVEWGENSSTEGKNKGYTHAVLMTFANAESLRQYLPHPEHEKIKQIFVPLLEDIVVFDYAL